MTFPANPFRAPQVKAEVVNEEKVIPPWHTVAVGESWLCDDYSNRRDYSAACVHGKRFGKKFSSQREGDSLRITRTA